MDIIVYSVLDGEIPENVNYARFRDDNGDVPYEHYCDQFGSYNFIMRKDVYDLNPELCRQLIDEFIQAWTVRDEVQPQYVQTWSPNGIDLYDEYSATTSLTLIDLVNHKLVDAGTCKVVSIGE